MTYMNHLGNTVRTIYLSGRKYIDAEDLHRLLTPELDIVIDADDPLEDKLNYISSKIKDYPNLELYNTTKHWGVRSTTLKSLCNKYHTYFFIMVEKRSYLTLLPKADLLPINYLETGIIFGVTKFQVTDSLELPVFIQKRYRDTVTLRPQTKLEFEATFDLLLSLTQK